MGAEMNKSKNLKTKKKFGNRFRKILIKDILVLPSHDHPSESVVSKLCDSMRIDKLINPITVRRAAEPNGGKFILVAGAHRLAAARRIKKERIEARVVKADDDQAKMIEISENPFRKGLSVLTRAEQISEYLEIAKERFDLSGQLDRKRNSNRTSGRPLGKARRILERVPGIGRSAEARRKYHARARLIARIDPEAKRIARAAKLDNNQRALLKIASQRSSMGQIRLATELKVAADTIKLGKSAKRNKSQETARKLSGCRKQQGEKEKKPSNTNTTTQQLLKAWNDHIAKLWLYTPQELRWKFIERLQRARRRSKDDVAGFIKKVFWGRDKIFVQDLLAYADSKGIRSKDMRRVLKDLCYSRRRKNKRAPLYYLNRDKEWKGQVRLVPEDEIRMVVGNATKRDAEEMAKSTAKPQTSKELENYLKAD